MRNGIIVLIYLLILVFMTSCGDSSNSGGGSTDNTFPVASRVPDTGQTTSYTDTFGEDSDYTINPPNYTKLDLSANDLDDGATSWTMVRDNVTGLIWEIKTDDGGIHDKDNTYTWQDAQDIFIAQLNSDNFGGDADWRLPTVKELSMLIHSDRFLPAINTTYFPQTMSWPIGYWSSTICARHTDEAWSVYFSYGWYDSADKLDSYYVRAVRGGQ